MSLTPDERADVAEALAERAAIREYEGGEPRPVAEAAARSAMRVYRLRVRMGAGQPDASVILLAPGCDLAEATRAAHLRFGADRVVLVALEWGGNGRETR